MCAAKVHCCKEPKYCSCFIIFNPCVCVCVRLCIQSLLQHKRLPVNCALIRLPRNMHCVGGGEQLQRNETKTGELLTANAAAARGSIWERQLSSWKEVFFSSSRLLRNRGPSFRYAAQLIQWKMRCFFNPTFFLLCVHTQSLFLSLFCFVSVAAACLLVCLFLEAHNMADMCFVIVSTTSYL